MGNEALQNMLLAMEMNVRIQWLQILVKYSVSNVWMGFVYNLHVMFLKKNIILSANVK